MIICLGKAKEIFIEKLSFQRKYFTYCGIYTIDQQPIYQRFSNRIIRQIFSLYSLLFEASKLPYL